MITTNQREWASVMRRYKSTIGHLVRAINRLGATEDPDDPRDFTLYAVAVLEKAADQVNAELTAQQKRLGIGTYTPYGRRSIPFGRR